MLPHARRPPLRVTKSSVRFAQRSRLPHQRVYVLLSRTLHHCPATATRAPPSATQGSEAAADTGAGGGAYAHLRTGERLTDECDDLDTAAAAVLQARGLVPDDISVIDFDAARGAEAAPIAAAAAADPDATPAYSVLAGSSSSGSDRGTGGAGDDSDDEIPEFSAEELWDEVGDEVPAYWDSEGQLSEDFIPAGPDTFTIVSAPSGGSDNAVAVAPPQLEASGRSGLLDSLDDDAEAMGVAPYADTEAMGVAPYAYAAHASDDVSEEGPAETAAAGSTGRPDEPAAADSARAGAAGSAALVPPPDRVAESSGALPGAGGGRAGTALGGGGEAAARRPVGRLQALSSGREGVSSAPRSGGGGSGGNARSGAQQRSDTPAYEWTARPAVNFSVFVDERDERASATPGYFVQKLQQIGVLDSSGRPSEGSTSAAGHSDALRVVINKLLTLALSWPMVLAVVRDLGAFFDGVNVSTAMHRVAKLAKTRRVRMDDVRAHPQYHTLSAIVETNMQQFAPRQLANTSWALASLGDYNEQLLRDMAELSLSKGAASFKEQELSNTVWAYGSAGVRHEPLITAFAQEMVARGLHLFTPQALSNVVWSHAQLGYRDEQFLQAVAEELQRRVSSFPSQAVSNIVWGWGSLGYMDPPALSAVCADISKRLHQFNCQELSNTLLACAKLEFIDVGFMKAFLHEAGLPGRMSGFVPQALANILWSFATLRFMPDTLIDKLSAEISRQLPLFKDQELANSVWAYAKLGHHPGRLLDEYAREIEAKLHLLGGQSTSNIAWGLAVLRGTHYRCFPMLVDRFVAEEVSSLDPKQVHQLFQALLLVQLEHNAEVRAGGEGRAGSARPQLFEIPAKLREEAVRQWQATAQEVQHSAFHQDVSSTLDAMKLPHANEYLTEGGLFSVDIALIGGSRKVALEVDGPFHFSINTLQPLGSSLLRYRLLKALGWTVVSVPFYEWYELTERRLKKEYLARKLSRLDSQSTSLPRPPPPALAEAAARAATAARSGSGGQTPGSSSGERGRGVAQRLPQGGGNTGPRGGQEAADASRWERVGSGRIAGPSGRGAALGGKARKNPMAATVRRQLGSRGQAGGGREQQPRPPPPPPQPPLLDIISGLPVAAPAGSPSNGGPIKSTTSADSGRAGRPQERQERSGRRAQPLQEPPTPRSSQEPAEAAASVAGTAAAQYEEVGAVAGDERAMAPAQQQRGAAVDGGDTSFAAAGGAYSGSNAVATAPSAPPLPVLEDRGGKTVPARATGHGRPQASTWRLQRLQQLSDATVGRELRPLCRTYGLPVSGKKQELMQRILEYEEARAGQQ